jgi:alpha-N-acetylgalactosaminidase
MDGCSKPGNASYDTGFPAMAAALNASGRPVLFSCSWPDYKRQGEGPGALDQVNFTALTAACNIW